MISRRSSFGRTLGSDGATQWQRALVTGASRGIGRALALALAERGVDLVLVARNEDRLNEVATEAEAAGPVTASVLPADLICSRDLAHIEQRLKQQTGPIDLLINNAAYVSTGDFAHQPVDAELSHIDVNVTATMRLTHAALPRMMALGHGGVCNIGSLIATLPPAGNASYSASKSFIETFTLALRQECRPHGVTFTLVLPGLVRTGSHERSGYDASRFPKWSWLDEHTVAAAAVDALAADRAICVPGGRYKVIRHLARAMPADLAVDLFNRAHRALPSRERAI